MERPSLPPPEAVVFDLDGTLVDTVPTRITAWLQVFAEFAIPVDPAFLASLIGADGKFLAQRVAQAAGRPLAEREDERIDRRSGAIYSDLNRHPPVLAGARQIIAALDDDGLPWAIATSSLAAQVTTSVAALSLARPPVIVDGSGVRRAKPAPDLLLAAARALDRDPSRCWYVGDATWDMLAAARADMLAVGVSTGAASAADLEEAGAVVVASDLSEVQAWL